MTGPVDHVLPGFNDKLTQRIYRQLTVGWTPFMGLFQAEAGQAFAYAMEGDPASAKFAWGPTMNEGKVWGFSRKMDINYVSKTVLPFIHWLYGGTKETWALQQLAINKGEVNSSFGVDMTKQGAKGYVSGTDSITSKGLTKGAGLTEKISKKLAALGNSQEKIQFLQELFGTDWSARDFTDLAIKDQLPDDFGKTYMKKAQTLGGPPNANPRFLTEASWRVDSQTMTDAQLWLAEELGSGIADLYRHNEDAKVDRVPKPFKGESAEETAIAIEMDRYNQKTGQTWSPQLPQQFIQGSTVGALPENLRGMKNSRQEVDISTKGAEGEFVYHLREHNVQLQKVIRMGIEQSVGIEITADDLAVKGGYSSIDFGGSIQDVITNIANFNNKQILELKRALDNNQQDLDKAVTELESAKGAGKMSQGNPLGFQARQTAVRLLDAASDNDPLTSGFEFTAPLALGGQNYMAAWGFNITTPDGRPAGLNGPFKIEATRPVIEPMGEGMTLFIDMVGRASSDSDADWQMRRSALFDDLMFQDLYKRGAEADGLLGQWSYGGLTPYTDNNVYPTTHVGFKMPFEIAQAIQGQLMSQVQSNASRGSFADTDLPNKVRELTNKWKRKMGTKTWEASKAFMKEGNIFGSSSGAKNMNQWVLPSIFMGGTAASYGMTNTAKGNPLGWSPLENELGQ